MIFKCLFLASIVLVIKTKVMHPEPEPLVPEPHPHAPELVFFIFPKECLRNLMNFEFRYHCIAEIISNALSAGIVVFSLYYKVPQIMKILTKKSAKGISPLSVLMEILSAMCGIAYYFYLDYDFMAYGEMVSGLVQSMIILSLCYIYREMGTNMGLVYFGLIVASISAIYHKLLPKQIISSLLLLSSIIFGLSRIMLTASVIRLKSPGSLSFNTLFLSMVGITVRVFTTFVNFGEDRFLLAIVVMNAFFSGLLFFIALAHKKPGKVKAN